MSHPPLDGRRTATQESKKAALHKERFSNRLPTKVETNNADRPRAQSASAATWASNRRVPQGAFKPDCIKHTKAAPFKHNDQMLDYMPISVEVFPGTGIQDNLADKARKMGIPVYRMVTGSA
jgi:hypothetical protein